MLEIAELSKRFGEVLAVDRVDLTVPKGRSVGFIGPNGAGKSTTMRSIFGLVEPDAGSITWQDKPLDRSHVERFGYMPEQRGLYPKMKVRDQVAFFAELKGVERDRARREAEELLGPLGLSDRLDDPLEQLSHGNQQRVQLAVSLVNDPELLVLDEPFNGLDPVAVVTLQEVLRERIDKGSGVLFSSHQLDLVERICDDVVVIVQGRIQVAGSVAEVRKAGGRRRLSIEVAPSGEPLNDEQTAPGVAERFESDQILNSGDTWVQLDVSDSANLGDMLAKAQAAGTVTRFDFDLPSLEDVFGDLAGPSNGNES